MYVLTTHVFHEGEVPIVLSVFSSLNQRVSSRLHALQARVLRWLKPSTVSLALGTFADLTRGKAELLAENARLAATTDRLASAGQTTRLPEEGQVASGDSGQNGSDLETGSLPCPTRNGSREGLASFSVCSGNTNAGYMRESRGFRPR